MKFHWGMKALIELHFQHEALPCFIENVLRSTLSYPNKTSKECIQFLNESTGNKIPTHGEVYSIQHYVIQFDSDL